jgi:nitrite reductase (NADH) small subunit
MASTVDSSGRVLVGKADSIPPGTRQLVEVGDQVIGVFNINGEFRALANFCPHRGAPVCRGEVTGMTESHAPYQLEWVADGEILRCPWHNWEFRIATGQSVSRPVRRIRTYLVSVEGDDVVLIIKSAARQLADAE